MIKNSNGAKNIKVTVLGAGNMGTSVAQVVANNGYKVNLWNYEGDQLPLEQIKKTGENKKYLKGVKLSKNIYPIFDLDDALQGVQVLFFVVPSNFVVDLIKQIVKFLPCGVVCVDISKGIDTKSLFLVPDIIEKYIPKCLSKQVVTISGPAIASDMVGGVFTAMDVSSKSKIAIKIVKEVLENKNLKLASNSDVVGVEVTGSFKNVYAIAMGLCDGLKISMNTKSALLVLALEEISLLVKKMGGKRETVYGLSGLGDLIGTGLCKKSRNRRFGECMAQGFSKDESCKKIEQVVEGINASKVLIQLSKKYNLKLPFAEMIYKIVWLGKKPEKEIQNFLSNLSL